MKKKKMFRIISAVISGTLLLSTLSGCQESTGKTEKVDSSTTEATSAVTTEIVLSETTEIESTQEITQESIQENTSQISDLSSIDTATSDSGEQNDDTNNGVADLSFVSGAPNAVEVWADLIDYEEVDGLTQANVDVIDTGSCYRLGISKIRYNLGITNYDEFIQNAVESAGYQQDENGKGRFTYNVIDENANLMCCGETFKLISYYANDAGRGYCEFLGEDGKVYYLNNDMSGYVDDFTSEYYFKLETTDGQYAYREIEFNGDYIDIPYDMAKSTSIELYIEKDVDFTTTIVDGDIVGGDPVGYFQIQLDSDGNIVKLRGV